jgi:thioredoxin-related protein
MVCLCFAGRVGADERAATPIHADLRQFLADANAEGKILLVDFSGDWCPWCVKLDRTIADTDVQALIKERFHYVKLDVGNFDKHVECLKQYNIHGIPYLIAFDSSGGVLKTLSGYSAPAAFLATLQKITVPKGKVIRDAAEYNAYIAALNTADASQKAAAMEAFVERYPGSIVKIDALEQAMSAWQQAGSTAKVADVAGRILQTNPDHVRALAIVAAIKRASGDPKAIAEAGEVATRGLKLLADWAKPDGLTDEEFASLRDKVSAIFNGAAGFEALQLKKYAEARDYYVKSLAVDSANMQDNYQLSVAQLQMEPLDATGFWYAAKAIALAQGNAATQQGISKYAKAMYRKYHGSEDGWDALIGVAVQQNAPSSDFAQSIKRAPTPAEIAVQAVRENDPGTLSFSDWEYVLSYRDASPDNQQAAQKVWQTIQDKQKGGTVKLSMPVKVIASAGDTIKVAITDENRRTGTADLTVMLATPTSSPPAVGSQITVIGVMADYTANPFMFTMKQAEFHQVDKN